MMGNKKVSIFISGDFCPIHRIAPLLSLKNVETVFKEVLPLIQNADISITNLECPLTDSLERIEKTGPALKGNAASLQFLEAAGFNMLSLANNHIMDYGKQGLSDTLAAIKKSDMISIGAGENYVEAANIHCKEINGIKIAFLNFAENEWSTTFGDKAGANPIDPVLNYNQIIEAKSIADKVIVICHGGHEMYNLPSPRMKQLFRFYVDSGADAVVNHHTHVISGYEVYKGAPIFYSLGNFLFDNPNQRKTGWNKGMSVILEISEKSISIKIQTFSQCDDDPVLILHKGITAQEVVEEIELLNLTIADDTLLEKSFNKYVKENIKQYSYYIEPHGNRYLNALRNRNLFPSLWSKQKKLYLLNLIRCESHRDVLLSILTK